MKLLIISGPNDVVVVAKNEREVSEARVRHHFDRVVDTAENPPVPNNVVSLARPSGVPNATGDLNGQVEALEERLITNAMAATGQNQVKAAQLLGITRGALQYKLKKYASKLQQAA